MSLACQPAAKCLPCVPSFFFRFQFTCAFHRGTAHLLLESRPHALLATCLRVCLTFLPACQTNCLQGGGLSQAQLIRRAFAGDDVAAEFAASKAEEIEGELLKVRGSVESLRADSWL